MDFDLAAVCPRCAYVPFGADDVLERVERHLGVRRSEVRRLSGRKVCDLKPLWPALFPELTARHDWLGYADTDIAFGDLSSEVERLLPNDDLLVPMSYYPYPLSNGNLLLMRTSQKMVHAFRRSRNWQLMLKSWYMGFDEWGTITQSNGIRDARSMAAVYLDMVLSGQLNARPSRRMLAQDTVIIRGMLYPTINAHAKLGLWWRDGRLITERFGPCYCPNDVIPQYSITACEQCLDNPGRLFKGVVTHRRLEVLGLHFQSWKRRFSLARAARNASVVPICDEPTRYVFSIGPRGFKCETRSNEPPRLVCDPPERALQHFSRPACNASVYALS